MWVFCAAGAPMKAKGGRPNIISPLLLPLLAKEVVGLQKEYLSPSDEDFKRLVMKYAAATDRMRYGKSYSKYDNEEEAKKVSDHTFRLYLNKIDASLRTATTLTSSRHASCMDKRFVRLL
jgi:hypothetical protein